MLQITRILIVIDHNMVFDENECGDFWRTHVFRNDRVQWTSNFKALWTVKMCAIADELPKIWSELPDDWTEIDCGLNLSGATTLLMRMSQTPEKFWNDQ